MGVVNTYRQASFAYHNESRFQQLRHIYLANRRPLKIYFQHGHLPDLQQVH